MGIEVAGENLFLGGSINDCKLVLFPMGTIILMIPTIYDRYLEVEPFTNS